MRTSTRAVRTGLDLDAPVDLAVIKECLAIGCQASNGSNTQGWRWIVVGRGSEEAILRELGRECGIGENLILAGALDDAEVHNLLEGADLFLVPSLYEGSSLAALEGMIHRLPLVATRAGGLPDKAIAGRTGFLAPPGDPIGLRAALAAALAARAEWPAYGANARALVEEQFDWPRLADRYLELYRSLRRG